MKKIYIGWTSVIGRPDLLTDPSAPSNYVDEAKKTEYIKKAREKQSQEAGVLQGVASVDSVDLFIEESPAGNRQAYFSRIGLSRRSSPNFLDELVVLLNLDQPWQAPDGQWSVPATYIGIGVAEFLRCLATDCLMSGNTLISKSCQQALYRAGHYSFGEYTCPIPRGWIFDPLVFLLPSDINGKVKKLEYIQAVLQDNQITWPKTAGESVRLSQLLSRKIGRVS